LVHILLGKELQNGATVLLLGFIQIILMFSLDVIHQIRPSSALLPGRFAATSPHVIITFREKLFNQLFRSTRHWKQMQVAESESPKSAESDAGPIKVSFTDYS
jgi:hypothetical protein